MPAWVIKNAEKCAVCTKIQYRWGARFDEVLAANFLKIYVVYTEYIQSVNMSIIIRLNRHPPSSYLVISDEHCSARPYPG